MDTACGWPPTGFDSQQYAVMLNRTDILDEIIGLLPERQNVAYDTQTQADGVTDTAKTGGNGGRNPVCSCSSANPANLRIGRPRQRDEPHNCLLQGLWGAR
jgi:hypothetical protein